MRGLGILLSFPYWISRKKPWGSANCLPPKKDKKICVGRLCFDILIEPRSDPRWVWTTFSSCRRRIQVVQYQMNVSIKWMWPLNLHTKVTTSGFLGPFHSLTFVEFKHSVNDQIPHTGGSNSGTNGERVSEWLSRNLPQTRWFELAARNFVLVSPFIPSPDERGTQIPRREVTDRSSSPPFLHHHHQTDTCSTGGRICRKVCLLHVTL